MKYKERNDIKKKGKPKLLHKFLSLTILVILFAQSTTAYAVEDNILGVPLEKFNGITDSSSRLQSTLEYYDRNEGNIGYELKYMLDSYRYMYEILFVAEELGENKVNVIPEHVANYNKLLSYPLTEEDQIDATLVSDDEYTIKTTSKQAKEKLSALAGKEGYLNNSEGEPHKTFYAELGRLREEVGMSASSSGDNTIDTDEQPDAEEYIKNNISNIRYLFTGVKEYIVDYSTELYDVDFEKLRAYFVTTYDEVMSVAIEDEIDGLADLDVWGEKDNVNKEAEGEDLLNQIGEWEEIDKEDDEEDDLNLKSYSEYMLKGIAASSTFRPFETNLNSTEAYSFLGDESSAFHEMHGTSRKLVLTVSDTYNNLNNALNLRSVKEIKFMTLRQFVENPDEPKVLYVDNLQYNLEDVDKVQTIVTEDEEKEEDTELDEDIEEVTEVTDTETNGNDNNIFNKMGRKIRTTYTEGVLWLNNLNPVLDFIIEDKNYYSTPDKVETLIFASGRPSDLGNFDKSLKENVEKVNASYLVYKNIIEEYWGMSTKLKMGNDLDKPLYVDIYGNILSASGVVIIPAISNPFIYKQGTPNMFFNRAVIESYPEYSVKNGELKVVSRDKKKAALYISKMNEKEMEKQEEDLDMSVISEVENYDGSTGSSDTTGSIDEETTGDLLEEELPAIPGVKFLVGNANKGETENDDSVGYVEPIAYKFNNAYEPLKSLDIWSFPQSKGSPIESYYAIHSLTDRITKASSVALIDSYTVKLTYSGTESSEVITFKEVPSSDELKRFIYITNLENIAKIEDNEIIDKGILSDHIYATTKQTFIHGIKDTNSINSLVPELIESMYSAYQVFLLEQANDRYNNALGDNKDNNIVYAKGIEEIDALKGMLPIVYKVLLLAAIIAIIFNIILTVIVQESKLKQLLKILTVMYLVTFIMNASSFVFDSTINKPARWMFSKETIFWTIIEQEKLANKKELATDDTIVEIEDDFGSQIKLYKIPFTYPYKVVTSNAEGAITIDEFYEHYLNNDGMFRAQNNEMYVDGNYLMVDTKTVFESSSIVEKDPENDVFLKLEHEIYNNPELAYYMPYYMFIDNIVYNLNTLTDLNTRIPSDVAYANGTMKTTGRIYDYINSAIFLDYDEYLKRLEEYETSDKISEELSIAEVKRVTSQYGENNDFLGIRKILGLVEGDDLLPFTEDGIANVATTGWYPQIEKTISSAEAEELERKALKVNDKVKMFMMNLGSLSEKVADEHLIKTIALYASFEFNKEFHDYAKNTGPVGIELSNVPLERLLMGLNLPREELIDSSITTYPNKILQEEGYLGLITSSANDFIILGINHVKPFLVVLILSLTAIVVFVRKVVLPDPKNRSILGSLKLIAVYILSSNLYSGGLAFTIAVVNWTSSTLISQFMLLVLNLAYLCCLLFLLYAMVKDVWNLGNSVVYKSLEDTVKGYGNALAGMASSIPLFDKHFGKFIDSGVNSARHLEKYLEQKRLKSQDGINDVTIFEPLDLSVKTLDKARGIVQKRRGSNGRPYNVDLPDSYRTSRMDNQNGDDSIIDFGDVELNGNGRRSRQRREERINGPETTPRQVEFISTVQEEYEEMKYNKEKREKESNSIWE